MVGSRGRTASRLYYSNLTSNFNTTKRDRHLRRCFEAIAVSRTDNPQAAAAGNASAWMDPVVISKQSSTTFSDKSQIWADNAQTSPFFGSVYVCWASFRSNSQGKALPTPLIVARSTDGGSTWVQKQVGPATDNGINGQPDGVHGPHRQPRQRVRVRRGQPGRRRRTR